MEKEMIVEKLNSLIQLDIDAIDAYTEALKNIDDKEIHKNLTSFRNDHKEHIRNLSEIVKKHHGQPPKKSLDFKGYFIAGFTTIRSMLGIVGALKAMQSNEKLTNSTYENALTWEMPKSILEIIKKNFNDEKRHLKYIQNVLEEKPWEQKAA